MSTSRRPVLILINSVDDGSGGNLRAAVNVAEALNADGVRVAFSAPVGSARPHRTIDLMAPGVERELFKASGLRLRFGGSARQARWLWRNVRTFGSVQTHSIFSLSAVYTIVICALRGVPVYLWPHGSLDPFDLRKHSRLKKVLGPIAIRPLLDRCVGLLFTTVQESGVAETYGSQTPHHIVPLPVDPLPTDLPAAWGWRARHGIPDDSPAVLFLGRIDYKKRLPLLVETVSLLERRDTHLVVVGDGPAPERELAVDAARQRGIRDRVHFTGWLEGDERAAAFVATDLFALLSDAENFGLSIIEAMSAGRPVVVSDQVSLAPALEAADAAIIVERDAVAAAKAIDALLADPQQAAELGARGRDFVAREFAPAVVARQLNSLVDRIGGLRQGTTKQHPAKRLYPEIAAGGYARRDGFIDFFQRARALIRPGDVVLDFGAGRAAWNEDPEAPRAFREVRDLRAAGARVIGVDVDPIVLENQSIDEAHVIEAAGVLPVADASVNLIVADHVFEHVSAEDAPAVVAEFARVLRPGGWICARTPNKRGLIGVAARVVPNDRHVAALSRLQPGREAQDVFPVRYAMNTPRDLRRLFPERDWTVSTYGHPGVQQYAGASAAAWRIAAMLDYLTPPAFAPTLMIFMQKATE